MKNKSTASNFLVIALTLYIIGIYILNYLTPMHSDDYAYSIIGFDLSRHIYHYNSWSGRIIADFISPTILSIHWKWLQSLIQTLGVASLLVVISNIPGSTKQNKTYVLLFISLIFFLSHPAFAKANFWVVGSANYLWTSLIYSLYICQILHFLSSKKISIYTYPIALMAGCTNENASLALIGFTALIFLFDYLNNNKINFKLLAILALVIAGSYILLAAPGNSVRLAAVAPEEWSRLNIIEKLSWHLSTRFIDTLKMSKLAYLCCIIGIFVQYKAGNSRKFYDNGKPTNLVLSCIFMLMALGSNLVMAFSPQFPERAMTPSFIFLMFSISISVHSLIDNLRIKKWLVISIITLGVVFTVEYLMTLNVYSSVHKQQKIRDDIISARTTSDVRIPDFYFTTTPSNTYKFDTWKNLAAMTQYYNYATLSIYEVNFDYSIINNDKNIIYASNSNGGSTEINKIYLSSDNSVSKSDLIIEFSNENENSKDISIKTSDMFGRTYEYTLEPNAIMINNRTFMHARMKKSPKWMISDIIVSCTNCKDSNSNLIKIKL